ncbi:sigma 54-interacting transcriptional regulator [Castellaniella sp. GW247-6E4]|uniref:sigma-54 interaction domain-containing protein n=1 Tax=Castellaniella sp. GW247-6E4 TaxID=3140380 RepID=UPI0033146F15
MEFQNDGMEPEAPVGTNGMIVLLEKILDVIPNCLIAINKSGRVTYINNQYCALLGMEKSAILGAPVTSVISPDTPLPHVARGAPPTHNQTLMVRGHRLLVNQVPIRYGDEVVGAVGIALFTEAEQIIALARRLFSIDISGSAPQPYHWMARYTGGDIVGASKPIIALRDKIFRAAQTMATVLIVGESGTGKELVAHSIHAASSRAARPFVHINCSAIPQSLLETELFGYEGGAFTGARPKGQPGKFELANSGTIFLDEIGDMPMEMQSALLRVLQEREIVRIGGSRPIPIDVRVICATHRDLHRRVTEERFRLDLLYRLNIFQIAVPALREHLEDIPALVAHILLGLRRKNNSMEVGVAPEVIEHLKSHDWPGNIRELQNTLEHAVTMLDGDRLLCRHLPPLRQSPISMAPKSGTLHEAVSSTERTALVHALSQAQGNKSRAARILRIDRTSLYKKLRAHDLI